MDYEVTTTSKLTSDRLATTDACAQAEMVKNGEANALEIVDAAIERIECLNPKINALASTNFDLARDRARNQTHQGPLAGVPTLLKDVLPYPGHPAGFGSQLLDGAPAAAGSPYTEALDSAGLVVLGKSTTSEFGLLGTTETLAKGKTRNPWDL
ncbi:MAG: amidase, partial [Roseibium sp.]|uniref:amidase family protein n=1 Tax=Roseibium sp. TaxID=1936156 RepID=UPI00262FC740